MEITTEKISIPVSGVEAPMPAYVAYPSPSGKAASESAVPAVIVLEEIFGVNSHIRDVTERVAKEGYVAIAPDYHHRVASGQELEYTPSGMKKGMELIPKLTTLHLVSDITATLNFLQKRKDVRADRIGCLGFCIGGHVAYLAAAKFPFRAAVSFYGGGITTFTPGGGPATVTYTDEIKGKMLCFFGKQDSSISSAQVETIKQALTANNIRHEVVVYKEAGHGFFCDQRGSYHHASATDAWERVRRLFKEELL